jgi:hypothetical protein
MPDILYDIQNIMNVDDVQYDLLRQFMQDKDAYELDLDDEEQYKKVLVLLYKYLIDNVNQNITQYVVRGLKELHAIVPKNKINISRVFGKSYEGMLKELQSYNVFKKAYVALDTRTYASRSSTGDEITWNIANNKFVSTGYINMPIDIGDVYAIKIMDYYLYGGIDSSMNKYTILIKNFASQSFVSNERNFHFWGTSMRIENILATYSASIIYERQTYVQFESKAMTIGGTSYPQKTRCSNNVDGRFVFDPPVRFTDTITLSFGNPFEAFNTADTQSIICFEVLYLPIS